MNSNIFLVQLFLKSLRPAKEEFDGSKIRHFGSILVSRYHCFYESLSFGRISTICTIKICKCIKCFWTLRNLVSSQPCSCFRLIISNIFLNKNLNRYEVQCQQSLEEVCHTSYEAKTENVCQDSVKEECKIVHDRQCEPVVETKCRLVKDTTVWSSRFWVKSQNSDQRLSPMQHERPTYSYTYVIAMLYYIAG